MNSKDREKQRNDFFEKVDIGILRKWLDLSLDPTTNENIVEAFKLMVLENGNEHDMELWDLLWRAAQQERFAEVDKDTVDRILHIVTLGLSNCFGLKTKDFEADQVNYTKIFHAINEKYLCELVQKFKDEIQKHVKTRQRNQNSGQVFHTYLVVAEMIFVSKEIKL